MRTSILYDNNRCVQKEVSESVNENESCTLKYSSIIDNVQKKKKKKAGHRLPQEKLVHWELCSAPSYLMNWQSHPLSCYFRTWSSNRTSSTHSLTGQIFNKTSQLLCGLFYLGSFFQMILFWAFLYSASIMDFDTQYNRHLNFF